MVGVGICEHLDWRHNSFTPSSAGFGGYIYGHTLPQDQHFTALYLALSPAMLVWCWCPRHNLNPVLVLGRRGAWGEALVKSCEIGKTGKTCETGYFLIETIVFIRFRAPDLQNPLSSLGNTMIWQPI